MRFLTVLLYSSLAGALLSGPVNTATAEETQEAGKAVSAFTMTTTAFLDQGSIPLLYTCDDKNLSPEFSWTNPPAHTKSFALVLADPDAPGGIWYHWLLYNIPANSTEILQGMEKLPPGTLSGKNSWGKSVYNGPCPPKGTVHNYVFTLYALDTMLKLPAGADAKTLFAAMKGHVLKTLTQTAVYSRWLK